MHDIEIALRSELRDPEYSEAYSESYLNAFIATQIKVIREQRLLTQADLAQKIGTTQAGISRIENVNYASWSIRTLTKIARAFSIRLRVSFETYGTLPTEVIEFERRSLERVARDNDPGLGDFSGQEPMTSTVNVPESAWYQSLSSGSGRSSIAKRPVVSLSDYKQSRESNSILGGTLSSSQEEPGGLSAACR